AAEKFGWLKAEGVEGKFDVRYFESGPPEIEAAIGGNLQMMGIGAAPVINALASNALPLRILGSVNEVTALFGLMAQKEIRSIADLRGKKIAVTLGANYQYFLEAALADAGMSAKDVTMIDSQPNEGTIAFLAGRVDATVPDYTDIKLIPRRREGAHVLVAGTDIGKKGGAPFRIFDLWVAPQKALDAHKPVLAGISRAVGKWAEFVGNPKTRSDAVQFAVDWGGKMSGKALNKGDIEATMEGAHFYDAAGQKQIIESGALAAGLKQQAEFLVKLGKLKRVPDFEAAVDKTFWS
ncbi:MAG TPA: ABC transporter substrate-binding protein, partial [Reyranella sp.]|nr:ABC transporter substrate-binding protein [Reyranella sp.]